MRNLQFWLAWILLVVFEAGSQVFLKKVSVTTEMISFGFQWLIKAASSIHLWASFACDVASFLVWIVILQRCDLSKAFTQSSVTFVAVIAASWLFFGEIPTALEWLGSALIVLGIISVNSR